LRNLLFPIVIFVLLNTICSFGCAWTKSSPGDGGSDSGTDPDTGGDPSGGDPDGGDLGGSDENSESIGFGPPGPHGERRISFLSCPATGFDAHGNIVVYTYYGKPFIIELDGETEKPLVDVFFDNLYVAHPHIWEDTIVFDAIEDKPNGERIHVVAVYNLNTKSGLILANPNSEDRAYSNIQGKTVVWEDYRFFSSNHPEPEKRRNIEVYMYDLNSGAEYRVTDAPFAQGDPNVFGHHIVWCDNRDPSQADVWMYDISTGEEFNISSHPSEQWAPSIWENYVVWQDLRNGSGDVLSGYHNTDIYMCDINTNDLRQITNNESDQESPKIFSKYIIWNDLRNGGRQTNGLPYGTDIYLYDLDTSEEKRVTWSTSNDVASVIAGDYIVWKSYRVQPDENSALYIKPLNKL